MAHNQSQCFPPKQFPWRGTFKTMEEVDTYFGQEKLICLICGKAYHSLHQHLFGTHEIPAAEYKKLYDIPWRRGLISQTLRGKQAKCMNRQRAEGVLPRAPTPEHIKKLILLSAINRRPVTSPTRNAQSKRALSEHGRTERWGKKDFEEYLRRIKGGRTVTEVGKDTDMPCREVFDAYKRANPEFDQKFEQIWDALPYEVQVRAQRTGERFKSQLITMRRLGFTWPQIAHVMKVKEGTVRSAWHRLKCNGELKK